MSHWIRSRIALASAVCIAAGGEGSAAIVAAPDEPIPVRVIFENASVRVLQNDYPRGAISQPHTHPCGRFIYVIAGGTLRMHAADGKTADVPLVAGRGSWRGPEAHSIENPGDLTVRVLEVEVKAAESGKVRPEDSTDLGAPSEAPPLPAGDRLALRNRWGSIVVHRTAPGSEFVPASSDRARFVYRLSGGKLRVARPGQPDSDLAWPAGSFDWLDAGAAPRGPNISGSEMETVEIILEGAPSGAE